MSTANDCTTVLNFALALPLEQRETIVRELVISIEADQPKEPGYDQALAEEILKRSAALDNGEDPGVDGDEVMRRIDAIIQRGTAK
ncbi:MAG TPA: addiction module protein [Pirellulales bacterium]